MNMNRKIAEIDGWTKFYVYSDNSGPDLDCGIPPKHYKVKENGWSQVDDHDRQHGCEYPCYTKSIEKIMAVVKRKCNTTQKMRVYVDFLVCEMKKGEFTVNASAKQRCKAFIKYCESEFAK